MAISLHRLAAALNAFRHVVDFDIAEHGGLDAAVGKVGAALFGGMTVLRIAVAVLDLRERKLHGQRVAVLSEKVDDRAAGIAEFEQLGDLVEGLAGGVVAGVADVAVGPAGVVTLGEVEVRVSSADNQGQHWKLQVAVAVLPFFQQYGVDVAFEMVDGDERLVGSEGEGLGVAESDEQGTGEARALGYGDGVDGFVGLAGVFEGLAHHGNDGAQMFARSQLGDDASEGLVRGDLRIDDVGDQFFAGTNDGGSGFVAGRLDAEDVSVGHRFIVRGRLVTG